MKPSLPELVEDASDAATNVFEFPKFRAATFAMAATNKAAGRMNAAAISAEEENALLLERQALLVKKLEGTATKKELNRLTYVRWSLDRIDDARHGESLDVLENRVAMYEGFLEEVQNISRQLAGLSNKK